MEDVWGETPPKTARHALENYVSELRRTLGSCAFRTEPAGYVLSVAPEQVDAMRLERLLDDDRRARDRAAELRASSLASAGAHSDLAFEPFAQKRCPGSWSSSSRRARSSPGSRSSSATTETSSSRSSRSSASIRTASTCAHC